MTFAQACLSLVQNILVLGIPVGVCIYLALRFGAPAGLNQMLKVAKRLEEPIKLRRTGTDD